MSAAAREEGRKTFPSHLARGKERSQLACSEFELHVEILRRIRCFSSQILLNRRLALFLDRDLRVGRREGVV